MYISKMKLENFKCFKGVKELTFNPGVNYFVGNNNSVRLQSLKLLSFLGLRKPKTNGLRRGKKIMM